MRTFVIGTRGSKLALRQTEMVRDLLLAAQPDARIEVRRIKTEGDASSAPLSVIGGTGVFTKAIEDALLAGEIDIAVHSLKDLPPVIAPGLTIAAVPERGNPCDALVGRQHAALADLPAGARIGTGSARRAVQLLDLRPDIEPVEIRGNVDTRIRKVDEGEYDAAVLAYAGLERLGLEGRASQMFHMTEMMPAVGQACLAVEVRTNDADAATLVEAIDHGESHVAARAERGFLARLGAGCRLPVGAWAHRPFDGHEDDDEYDGGDEADELELGAIIAAGQPARIIRGWERGAASSAEEIGTRLAESLIAQAGGDFMDAAS